MNLYAIEAGGRSDIPIQCVLRGGLEAGGFAADDILTGELRPLGSNAVTCSPSVEWYTAHSTQNGYDQQQVEASFLVDDAALLQPSIRYVLTVKRAPAGDDENVDIVAKILLIAKGLSDPE